MLQQKADPILIILVISKQPFKTKLVGQCSSEMTKELSLEMNRGELSHIVER